MTPTRTTLIRRAAAFYLYDELYEMYEMYALYLYELISRAAAGECMLCICTKSCVLCIL